MTKFNQTARRRMPQIDPKTLKKRSHVRKQLADSVVVLGRREPTETGFVVPGYSGSTFETYFETLLPGSATALMQHPKKVRVVRIVDGTGVVAVCDDGVISERTLNAGDEVVLASGTSYRFATTSGNALSMFVTQSAKYTAKLEILEPATLVEVPSSVLRPGNRTPQEPPVPPRRGSNKARVQQAARAGTRLDPSQVIPPAPDIGVAAVAEVMNVRPSMGAFADE